MKSFLGNEKPDCTPPTGNTAHEAHGLASTLKSPRLPEPPAFGNWASSPDKFKSALMSAQEETNVFDASLRALYHRRPVDNSMPRLKLVEFCVSQPAARTVQLAADFTDWDESPIDMMRFEDGMWATTVPLPVGTYAYRFLVDGEWYDDPQAIWGNAKSADETKAFIQIK